MDGHGIDAGHFHQDDVAQQALDGIGIIHGAAAEPDEKCLPAKPLQLGQGVDEHTSFGDFLEQLWRTASSIAGARCSTALAARLEKYLPRSKGAEN